MYEEFYGLTTRPFSKTPDPKFLYYSRTHEEALARLQYAVEEREMILLTGEVGCGKTTLTRALMDVLDDRYRVITIINPILTPAQFLRTIAKRMSIDIPSQFKADLLDAIYEQVYSDHENGVSMVLVIDEAHLIPNKEMFEEIRLLTNFQLDYTNLISIVLAGQTDLRRRLNHKAYLPLRQRIGLFYHIGPLAQEEIKGYVEHRLAVSGRQDILFTDLALKRMFHFSAGVPRIINSIATSTLLDGYARNLSVVDEKLVEDAARELGLNGYREN